MRRVIRDNPGEVVLLPIGPLTNRGLLFTLDPEIPTLLKGLVLMCGVFGHKIAGNPAREWNAFNDPEATAIVYRARPPVHRSIELKSDNFAGATLFKQDPNGYHEVADTVKPDRYPRMNVTRYL